jgi:hypothetical protein
MGPDTRLKRNVDDISGGDNEAAVASDDVMCSPSHCRRGLAKGQDNDVGGRHPFKRV